MLKNIFCEKKHHGESTGRKKFNFKYRKQTFLGFILKTNSNTRYNKTDFEKICCHIFLITFCV